MTMKIDWKKPIELLGSSGAPYEAKWIGRSDRTDVYVNIVEAIASGNFYRANEDGKILGYCNMTIGNVAPKPVVKNYWAVTYINVAKTLGTVHLRAEDDFSYKIGDEYKSYGKIVHISEFSLAL